MKVPFLNLVSLHQKLKDEIFKRWEELYDKCDFIQGEPVFEFESKLAEYCQVPYAKAVDTGTSAVTIALKAVGVMPGDEVITVSNTFFATIEGICLAGATPVFVEIDENTWNMDREKVEAKITAKTKAILPVNLYGQPADLPALEKIARKHNLKLVIDSAQSIGSMVKTETGYRMATSFGDACSISFYPGKNLGACGEGGAIVTKHAEVAAYVDAYRNHGGVVKNVHEMIGSNHRMHNLQAAALDVKLPYLESWNARRREIAELYREHLQQVEGIKLPQVPQHLHAVFHVFVVLVENREAFRAYLQERGIATGEHYHTPIHLQKAMEYLGLPENSLPITERVVARNVSLPVCPEMTDEMVLYTIDCIKEFLGG